jgi:hypothetical protein
MLAESLTILRAAYPRAQFPTETVTVYVEALADLPDEEVAAACRRLVLRAMYLPSIAEIRRDVIERRHGWPTPGEAWQLALTGAAHGHPCEPLAEAYKAMGGKWGVQTATNLGALRHGFERDYDQRVEQAVLADMTAKGGRAHVLPPAGERGAVAAGSLAADIPSTPVERRMARRFLGEDLRPPTDEEKADAIRVLRDDYPSLSPKADAIYVEAERIFAEGAS